MGYSVKKRIFGSDLPDNIKAKVSLRQLYAESPNPTDEKLKKVLGVAAVRVANVRK